MARRIGLLVVFLLVLTNGPTVSAQPAHATAWSNGVQAAQRICTFWRDRWNGTVGDGHDYRRSRCSVEGATAGNYTDCNSYGDEVEMMQSLQVMCSNYWDRFEATFGTYDRSLMRATNRIGKDGRPMNADYNSFMWKPWGIPNDALDYPHIYEPAMVFMRTLFRQMPGNVYTHLYGKRQAGMLRSSGDDLMPATGMTGGRGLMFISPRGVFPHDYWPTHTTLITQPQMAMENMALTMTTFGMFAGVGASHPLWSDVPGANNANFMWQLYSTWASAIETDDTAGSGKPAGYIPASILADGSFGDNWCDNNAHPDQEHGGWAKGGQYGLPYFLQASAILMTGNETQKAAGLVGMRAISKLYCHRQKGETMPDCGSTVAYDGLYLAYVALRPEEVRLEDVANGCDAALFGRNKDATVDTTHAIAHWQAEMAKPSGRDFTAHRAAVISAMNRASATVIANETAWTTGAIGDTESVKFDPEGDGWAYLMGGVIGGYNGSGIDWQDHVMFDPDAGGSFAQSLIYVGREVVDAETTKHYYRVDQVRASNRAWEIRFKELHETYGRKPGTVRISICADDNWDFECEVTYLTYNNIDARPGAVASGLIGDHLNVQKLLYIEVRDPIAYDPANTPDFAVHTNETSWTPDFTAQAEANRTGTVRVRVYNVGTAAGDTTVSLVDNSDAPLPGIVSKVVNVDPQGELSELSYTLVTFTGVPQGEINVTVNGDYNIGNNKAVIRNE